SLHSSALCPCLEPSPLCLRFPWHDDCWYCCNHCLLDHPLLFSSVRIIVCLITTLFATDFFEVKAVKEIEPALKKQLIISTTLMTVGIAVISWLALLAKFTIFNFGTQKDVSN
uniref:H(+)-exporting diphosphatase n=1 Tax=Zea mays TaxID=4577 RepID=A0A804PMG5_MAIZE